MGSDWYADESDDFCQRGDRGGVEWRRGHGAIYVNAFDTAAHNTAVTGTLTAATNATSGAVRFSAFNGGTLVLQGQNTIASGGILVTGTANGSMLISGGAADSLTAPDELIVHRYSTASRPDDRRGDCRQWHHVAGADQSGAGDAGAFQAAGHNGHGDSGGGQTDVFHHQRPAGHVGGGAQPAVADRAEWGDVDLTNHDAILGNTTLATVQTQVLAASGWAARPPGARITSSTGLAAGNTFLVPVDADALLGDGTSGSAIGQMFDGMTITQPGTVLLKYAYIGDVTLDGTINGLDFATAAGNYGTPHRG